MIDGPDALGGAVAIAPPPETRPPKVRDQGPQVVDAPAPMLEVGALDGLSGVAGSSKTRR